MKIRLSNKTTDSVLLAVIIIIACFFHATNMFKFPFFENDEGIYFAQAWSFLSKGKLSPYTYWYDHAPFGWIFSSLWIFFTGGLFSFGNALHSARLLMLETHIANSFLLYLVGKRITNSRLAVLVATIFFSISPLAVYFQRRMLLDNLMVFWLLLSIFFLYRSKKLRNVYLSAIAFGLAVLTKENAIFFLPSLAFLTFKQSHDKHKELAFLKWIVISGCVISIYPLFALLKGELFPVGSMFSPPYDHVSLIETLKMQSSRGAGVPFWHQNSDFRLNIQYWLGKDTLLIIAGYTSFLIHGLLSFWNKKSRTVFLLTLPMVAFLSSGKLVINFYIVPVIPFFALSIGLLSSQIYSLLGNKFKIMGYIFTITLVIFLVGYYSTRLNEYLTRDETTKQKEAVSWIKKNVEPNSTISIDFYSYLDLSESRFQNEPNFPNADWFWKVELDPDIRVKKLQDNANNLEFIMMTAEVERQLIKGFSKDSSIIHQALANSHKVAEFSPELDFDFNPDFVNQHYPNGDWVVIYKKNKLNLEKVWNTYKKKFISDEGMVATHDNDTVLSEAQAYAMLRSVWMNDEETFVKVWSWTIENLKLEDSNLFGWKWDINSGSLIDGGNATDADQDIALALLLASTKWSNKSYEMEARRIIVDIWEHNVFESEEAVIITAGNWAENKEYITVNPSYFAPYAYRLFGNIDSEHNWDGVIDSSYDLLDKCSSLKLGMEDAIFLPPEWCRVSKNYLTVSESKEPQPVSTDYAFNAFRIPWRLYLDYQWNKEERAKDYLQKLNVISDQVSQGKKIYDAYDHQGKPISSETKYGSVMNLPILMITDQEKANKLFVETLEGSYKETDTDAYWLDGNEYYLQNWYWFMTGLYKGVLQQ